MKSLLLVLSCLFVVGCSSESNTSTNSAQVEQEKIEFAALALAKKVSDITGIQTSYYGLINFD